MKRILLLVLIALWMGSPAHAQTKAKLCFPTSTGQSCQDVTATNPLPTSASVNLGSALNVTVVNTTAVPAFISTPNIMNTNCVNCATASVSGTLTVQNLAAGSNLNVLDTNSNALLAAVQGSIPPGTNTIGGVTSVLSTTGGATSITMANLLTTPNAIKASAGQLLKVYCYNPNSSVAYLQVFNVASGSVTPGSTKPLQFYGIPATSAAGYAMSPVGDQYSTAISAVATTTATGGTPPSTGMDCSVSFN